MVFISILYLRMLVSRLSSMRSLGIAVTLLVIFALAPMVCSQTVIGQNPQSFYKTLDRQFADAKDTASIQALFIEIQNRNLFGPIPPSVLNRLVRTQEAFLRGNHTPVTEASVADAVNAMGRALDPTVYTGTNAAQVRLLRIHMLPMLPSLLASGSARPSDKIVANDLSPAGAVYLGLLLLRQKMANPAWFGDPDTQNKQWLASKPKHIGGASVVRIQEEPPEQTNFRLQLEKGFANESSSTTKAFHLFLDKLNIKK